MARDKYDLGLKYANRTLIADTWLHEALVKKLAKILKPADVETMRRNVAIQAIPEQV